MNGWKWTPTHRYWSYARGYSRPKARVWRPNARPNDKTDKWIATVRDGQEWHRKDFDFLGDAQAWVEMVAAQTVAARAAAS